MTFKILPLIYCFVIIRFHGNSMTIIAYKYLNQTMSSKGNAK